MKSIKVKEKLKKSLIVTIVAVMIAFLMPVRSKADIVNDFVDLILRIPDGVMNIIDSYVGGSNEFTSEELGFYGGWDEGGRLYNFIVTPYDIFSSGSYEERDGTYYTKLGLLDINFFSDRPITSDTIVSSQILAPVIGNVYKGLRNFCMVLMLLVVLYIGIKIMISSVAAQQAKYKQLLVDWVVGFCLLFVMHYIMSGIVYLNTIVVKMLSNEDGDSYYVSFAELEKDVNMTQTTEKSTWFNVARDYTNDVFWDKLHDSGVKYENFKNHRLIVRNSVLPTETFTNYIDKNTGKIDLSSVPQGTQSNYTMTTTFGYVGANKEVAHKKWGKDGVIYLSAKVINPGDDNEKYEDKAIVRLNTMSYVRTISSFSSEDNDSVLLYDNGGQKNMDMAATTGYSILYLCLVIETIMFTFTYIKRVLQMSFLTMIAPIVAIMYPVDKIGDGKAQAFNTWFKDYLFNILIQPMHLLLYTIFIVAAGQLVSRNIIYGLAIYGFMIPAEKYFKKILGFEKASTGGGGPLGGAVGRGLAMDGLGRLAGIGPAARHGKGGSGDGKGKNRIKTTKNKATPGTPASDGGASGPNGSGAQNGSGNGSGTIGQMMSRNRRNNSAPAANGRRPASASSTAPYRNGAFRRGGKLLGKGISRAVTGGEYSNLFSKNAGKNGGWKAAGRYTAKSLGGFATKVLGAGLGGAVGLTAGAATAMVTGDINNLWKGTAVGAGAGKKLSSNLYDRGTGFLEDFDNDMKQELANEDSQAGIDYNAALRTEEAYKTLDEELRNLPDDERKHYEDMIDSMAPYVNIKSVEDAKALYKMKDANGGAIDATELTELYDDSSGMDVASHRDAYLKKKLMEMEDTGGNPKYTEQQVEDIINGRGTIAAANPNATDYNNAYADVVRKAGLVEIAQSIRK